MDLLPQLAADIEEIKTILNSVAGTGVAGKNSNAISNDVAVGDGLTPTNPDRIIAEIKRLLEPIADVCSKPPDRIKSYYAQLLLHIPQDLREELTCDNDACKCKGLPTVEGKIDNSMTMLISIYDRLN